MWGLRLRCPHVFLPSFTPNPALEYEPVGAWDSSPCSLFWWGISASRSPTVPWGAERRMWESTSERVLVGVAEGLGATAGAVETRNSVKQGVGVLDWVG